MPVELASRDLVRKPWGAKDPRPWCQAEQQGEAIGEIWFGRADAEAPSPALLLKLLLTQAPLSIQVHPDDTFARSVGLPNGKTEAWYVVAANPDSRVALGLKTKVTPEQLRAALLDGTIADLVAWRAVEAGEAVFVPAGTIHAIGAGLTIVEVQQRSDTTYRLHDLGRNRPLDIVNGLAVAQTGPAQRQTPPVLIAQSRTLLINSPYFAMERITLPAVSDWWLNVGCESWLFVLGGNLRIGAVEAGMGEAIYCDEDHARLRTGPDGIRAILAYALPQPIPNLLEKPGHAFTRPPAPTFAERRALFRPSVRPTQATA